MPTFIARDIKALLSYLNRAEVKDKKIGLVPTMGALHKGHMSLVEKAKELSELIIVTIFVNPMQFNSLKDLKPYPSTESQDIKKLKKKKVDLIFIPNKNELYSKEFSSYITLRKYDDILCSKKRKNHFSGVANIVIKMFNLCKPTYAFFGEKDYQQLVIIRKLVEDFNFNIKILSIKTVRDKSGLALSSRNRLLSKKEYQIASEVNNIILEVLKFNKKRLSNCLSVIRKKLIDVGVSNIEYLEIRSEKNLRLIRDEKQKIEDDEYRIFIAFYLGSVRLIDNMQIHSNQHKL